MIGVCHIVKYAPNTTNSRLLTLISTLHSVTVPTCQNRRNDFTGRNRSKSKVTSKEPRPVMIAFIGFLNDHIRAEQMYDNFGLCVSIKPITCSAWQSSLFDDGSPHIEEELSAITNFERYVLLI